MRGPTCNPWSLGHTPGGSSGGSAAAVAAPIVPMAHGGDGGGSIRSPRLALRPGRPQAHARPHPFQGRTRWSAGTARSSSTCCAARSATAPPPSTPPTAQIPATWPRRRRPSGRSSRRSADRQAACGSPLPHNPSTRRPRTRAGEKAVLEAANLARQAGHDVVEAHPPSTARPWSAPTCWSWPPASARRSARSPCAPGRKPRAADYEPATWMLGRIGEAGRRLPLREPAAVHPATGAQAAAFFEDFDVLLTATAARPPARIGEFALKPGERLALRALRALPLKKLLLLALDRLAEGPFTATPNTMLFNQTGQPAISLPLHWNAEGLPIGTQSVGRLGRKPRCCGSRPSSSRRGPGPDASRRCSSARRAQGCSEARRARSEASWASCSARNPPEPVLEPSQPIDDGSPALACRGLPGRMRPTPRARPAPGNSAGSAR